MLNSTDVAQHAWWASVRDKSDVAGIRCPLCCELTPFNSESHWQEHYFLASSLKCAQAYCNLHFTWDQTLARMQVRHVGDNITLSKSLSIRSRWSEIRAMCDHLHTAIENNNMITSFYSFYPQSEPEPSAVIPTGSILPRRRRFKLRAEAEPEPVLYLPGGAIG